MSSQPREEVPRPYGLLARTVRERKALTLDELSAATGLSKGHLSRFERGEKALSIAALMRVAGALDTSVSRLLGEHVEEGELHLVRAGERMMHHASEGDGGYSFAVLGHGRGVGEPSAFFVEIGERARRISDAYHAGEELIFVLSGSVEMELPDREVLLSEGDYFQFPGYLRHILYGRASHSRLLVIVTGKDSEQLDVAHPRRQSASRSYDRSAEAKE